MKLLVITLSIAFSGIQLFAQGVQTSSLLSVHHVEIELAPGVAFNDFYDYYVEKVIPTQEKIWRGIKIMPLKGIRGECNQCIGYVLFIPSKELRDKYFTEGGLTEYSLSKLKDMKEIFDGLDSLGKVSKQVFTDWEVL